jgi:hypothetical protein
LYILRRNEHPEQSGINIPAKLRIVERHGGSVIEKEPASLNRLGPTLRGIEVRHMVAEDEVIAPE